VVFEYRYSQDKRHNLTEILYANKTSMQITYFGKELFENVKSVKERDGSKSEYTYWTSPKDAGHTRVGSRLLDKEGKEISKSSYEYFSRKKGDGEDWTYKIATNIDGDVSETTYNECCGLPLVIKKGGQESAFTYDKEGRVLKKVTPSETTLLTYDAKVGKVNRVEKHIKSTNKKEWSEFKYDDKGNLTFARNSDNKGVRLFYDLNGRIKTMVDQNKKQIDFTYNEHSKPIEIKDPAGGAIRVTYKNSGEVDKVDSSGGRDLANQVSTSFQGLLEIVKPAGVSLSF
jgi:YD repeat-containing protein